jgi:trans-L-3-hydroxyproline dehydratase
VFADGALDRSPTGTGVAGRVAIMAAKGEISAGQEHKFESITGESFAGRLVEKVRWHGFDAVVTEVEGTAYITGRHEFVVEDGDPLADGFLIR